MTALIEADRARKRYKKNRDVPLIMDGGITSAADMIIALTIAEGIMLGGYLNKFYEAEGEKLNENGEVTIDDVPNGNYTAKIFHVDGEIKLAEAEVSAFLDLNYVKTQIIHFPILILIFGGITGIILILGLKIYRKREKTRTI